MPRPLLTERPEWLALQRHFEQVRDLHLRDLFAADPDRARRFTAEAEGIVLDYSKHRITPETVRLLVALAEACDLRGHIDAMFRGDVINVTEERPALHVALRTPPDASIVVGGENVVPAVHKVLDRMSSFANRVRDGSWRGHTGRPIRNVVNIGIGGSDLGPRMAVEALRPYADPTLTVRFLSNVDGADFIEATRGLDPAETLFIVCSKTFTTLETMTNARTARDWLLAALDDPAATSRHFVAVSTNETAVRAFGIDPENMFGFWDWVGGRYSMDSAVGLSLMLAIGPEHFRELLAGFHAVDEHVRTAPFEASIPVLMALLTLWYNNCFAAESYGVMPYAGYLASFPAYLQQLTMESNGKRVTVEGQAVPYQTGPVVWGEPGTNSQHSFFQLLHQGTKLVPVDFIGFRRPVEELGDHHDLLTANLLAQASALAFGRTAEQLRERGIPDRLVLHQVSDGNRPSSVLLLDQLTPASLGKLVALYEHRVYVEGVLWGIDSFDQWGVELGKEIAGQILPALRGETDLHACDSSTASLIARFRSVD
ncbi:MAG: glucose-6-phosphate isomerase [Dehalococcoidia bacterium]